MRIITLMVALVLLGTSCHVVNRKVAYRCHRLTDSGLRCYPGIVIKYFDSAYRAGDTISPYDDDTNVDYYTVIERAY